MDNLLHAFALALRNIKRAPLPYLLTVLILSLGLGMFFSNATLYYWLNHDPLPQKSHSLFYPQINSVLQPCDSCTEPMRVLSYQDVQKLSSSGIPSAQAAMFQSAGYARLPGNSDVSPTPVRLRVTQRDFFTLFDVPFLHGERWADDTARRELILSKASAERFFGRSNVVGETLRLGNELFTISGVLQDWEMLPRLYDVANGLNSARSADIYLPWETAFDLGIKSNTTTMSRDERDYSDNFAVNGREGQFYQAQFWVQLDSPQQVTAYQQFMQQLVHSEKEAGRHPRPEANRLTNILDITEHFNARNRQLDAFALVSLLFLLVCLFNASHLSLNRYLASQYEFGLRRALGCSRSQLQQLILADVAVSAALALFLSLAVAAAAMSLIASLLPATRNLTSWNPLMVLTMAGTALIACYLVTLYPALRASFGSLNRQLK
ncbi:ABC transporter permease [Arsukibacterium indicum]|uniref:ABC transporter permease n=1 Tax=Arsukibacterium indicum TaxID=2848612 RepID=A0ABS6MQJ1_9GAMM|nr:ABC transporter permease [Arsukibacterium indicum]MBV2131069.1 ABC transporter permease [Arsukibacterium indicum]